MISLMSVVININNSVSMKQLDIIPEKFINI